jgi:ribosomal protein L11 methyltransferase
MTPSSSLWRVVLGVPARLLPPFEAVLETFCMAVSSFEDRSGGWWRLEGLGQDALNEAGFSSALDTAAQTQGMVRAPAFTVEAVAERDWVRENLDGFPPLHVGRFFIYGSHCGDAVPAGRVGLMVDAGQAFGTGRHESTLGCLLALDALARARRFTRVLDVGCGSGILSLAAAKLMRARVTALDCDRQAVCAAAANIRRNGVASLVRVGRGRGMTPTAVGRNTPYDLIFVNILPEPIIAMALLVKRHLSPGGVAVLSGILRHQAARVVAAYGAQRLFLLRRVILGDWVTLVLS